MVLPNDSNDRESGERHSCSCSLLCWQTSQAIEYKGAKQCLQSMIVIDRGS